MAGEPTLVGLVGEVGAALVRWAQPSSSQDSTDPIVRMPTGYQLVDSDTTLVFDWMNPQLNLELPQLRRILENASVHSGMIYAYLNEQDANALGRGERAKLHTALRLAVTMRDSLGQMARLVAGEDLNMPPHIDGESPDALWGEVTRLDRTIDAVEESARLREAEIFKRVKAVQMAVRAGNDSRADLDAELQSVLDHIKEGCTQ